MKLSLYEGTSRLRATLLMTGSRTTVTARKRERDASRRHDRALKRWTVEVPDDTPDYDRGKGGGGFKGYNDRHGSSAAPIVQN